MKQEQVSRDNKSIFLECLPNGGWDERIYKIGLK